MAEITEPTSEAPAEPKEMIDILVRVDLLGMPDESVFAALHGGMTAQKWLTTLTTDDGQLLPLPGETFSKRTDESISDLSQQIHDWIVAEIWEEGAIVLVNELASWSIAGNE
jgi:hypothetical protein